MHPPAASESAAQLSWIWPDAHSLAALAQPLSPATWPILRRDPGALLLVLRRGNSSHSPADLPSVDPTRFFDPLVLETTIQWLSDDHGRWIDWRTPGILAIYQTALAIAHHARLLANLSRCCDPVAAWTAGLLAPLGWFAVAAEDPTQALQCLTDPDFAADPLETQRRTWGADHQQIAQQMIERWELPDWLDAADDSPAPAAPRRALRAVTRLAILLAERAGFSLGLAGAADEAKLTADLRLTAEDLAAVRDRMRSIDFAEAFEPDWCDPRESTDLPAMLERAIAGRKSLVQTQSHFNREVTPAEQSPEESEQLRLAKLAALAEFAAGASHEINNPLAVISGQSQYLLHRIPDERQRQALESIVRQTQRIHDILAELMQFARPPRPAVQRLPLNEVLRTAIDPWRIHAAEAGVALDCNFPNESVAIDGDLKQLQTAIGCLVRNAVEAVTPDKGWVRVGINVEAGQADVFVEDSGLGPTAKQREHMFDPFYSGRTAGRGRGLGLPMAWRLAKEHGGDVRHVPNFGGPTRFVLSLPVPEQSGHFSERLSA